MGMGGMDFADMNGLREENTLLKLQNEEIQSKYRELEEQFKALNDKLNHNHTKNTQRSKRYYAKNKESVLQQAKVYYENNVENIKEQKKIVQYETERVSS